MLPSNQIILSNVNVINIKADDTINVIIRLIGSIGRLVILMSFSTNSQLQNYHWLEHVIARNLQSEVALKGAL